MKIKDLANLSTDEFAQIKNELANHKTLGQVLAWANAKPKGDFLPQIVSEVITQDEYTHDVVIPFRKVFLVFDTT